MFKTLLPTPLIAAALAIPASAGTPAARQAKVAVADLNLATAPGQAKLDHRLAVAIRQVCGAGDQRDLTLQAELRRCRESARKSAAPRRAALIAAATTSNHGAVASR